MAKKSKLVDNRIQSSQHVIGAAKAHRESIASALADRAISVQGPNTKATKDVFLVLFDFLADSLGGSIRDLDAAELRLVAERADDIGLRDERDFRENDLRNAAIRVRSMVFDALGERALSIYGLNGATPRTPREIASHARTVSSLLKEKPFSVTVDGVSFDSAALADNLDKKALALDSAIETLHREDQELASELGQRDRQVDRWSDDHQGVADTLVGLFRLAGRKDLSERVRPTSRTLSGDDVPNPTPTPPEAPAGSPEG